LSNCKGDEPAFPSGVDIVNLKRGMTLRDYFAAKAMQALITGAVTLNQLPDSKKGVESLMQVSYGLADAALKARNES
jgi:hypothetical protein